MYNFVIDYTQADLGTITEPVTVAEAKQYCRVDNNVENDLFAELITQSRQAVEKAANISITPKTITLWFTNSAGNFQLPFGPMTAFTSLTDQNGNDVPSTVYNLVGGQYPNLQRPEYVNMKAIYTTGMTSVPKELKIAILDQINYGYENRGMDVNDMGICEKTWRVCQRWTRTSPIL
jgi:hypothetical protein